jgi:hypothetical protein
MALLYTIMGLQNKYDLLTSINSNEIKNKGFVLLCDVFKKNDWSLVVNEFDKISFIQKGCELDSFDITIDKSNIYAHIPMKNSQYKFETSFTSYYDASEYIESRLNDFIE